jgi:hypothetical protein
LMVVLINSLVLTNTIFHDPNIGYDVTAHLINVHILPYRLATQAETYEFFSPPLGYILPALVDKVCLYYHCTAWRDRIDGKSAQVINFFLSIGITILFWKIAELLRPGNKTLKISMLAMLGILTVYYKTFSQARGEPYVAFFAVWVIFLVLKVIKNPASISWKNGILLGVALGLLVLSRQWGFFLFPALAALVVLLFIIDHKAGYRLGGMFALSVVVAALVGGWFYVYLYRTYGSFTAAATQPSAFSLANHPLSYYTGLGVKGLKIIRVPIRPNLGNSLIPIFYSDTWGDYWGYFSFVDPNYARYRVNRAVIAPYLGRVNLVSFFPTLILLAGLTLGGYYVWKLLRQKEHSAERLFLAFLFFGTLASWLGYMWLLITYADAHDNFKPTYMIQIFMCLPILGAFFLEKIRTWKPVLYRLGMWLLLGVFVHNLPAMITHFSKVLAPIFKRLGL